MVAKYKQLVQKCTSPTAATCLNHNTADAALGFSNPMQQPASALAWLAMLLMLLLPKPPRRAP
jgi:hypothetical protein